MRNIALYPLSDEEIIQHCERELEKFIGPDAPVGGMEAMIYGAIIQRIKNHPYEPSQIEGNPDTTTATTTANS